MQLPEALQPWRDGLEGFAPEYWPLFVDLFGRLNPVLGPLRGRHQGGVPEPDGLGDLQRRGPYERLLASEWLLADEVPEEFLRRAVVGEHLFLAPQYRAREASRLIVVLFDAGPLQLGAARLVHMALLILLARRAEEAGAQLRWGVLQHEPLLQAFDSPAQLKQLLDARTYAVVNDTHCQAWQDWLTTQPQVLGECWTLGQRLPELPAATHRARLQRSLDGTCLMFELMGRRVALPIPPQQPAVALLKGQFAGAVKQAPVVKGGVQRVALTLAPVISSAGTHIALKLLEGQGMVVIKLPAEKQVKNLTVSRHDWPSSCSALAMVFHHRRLGALVSDSRELSFWNISGLAPMPKPAPAQLMLTPGTSKFLPAVWLRHNKRDVLYLLDTLGQLVYWSSANGPPNKIWPVASDVMGMAQTGQLTLAFVYRQSGQLFANVVMPYGQRAGGYALGAVGDVSQVLFAANAHWLRGFGGCALLTRHDNRECWRVIGLATQQQIELSPNWKAIGILLDGDTDKASLVLISPNRQSITVYDGGQQNVLFTTTQPISRLSYCAMSGLVAALTEARELLVYSVPSRTLRLQVMCNDDPEPRDD